MCIIIVNQKGKKLPEGVLKKSARMNPHGLGIMWLDTWEATYHKSKEFGILETQRPYIAHFRYATVGAIGRENTHPFQCGKREDEWLMMNGTIPGIGNKKTCDSKILAQALGLVPRHKWSKELAQYQCRFVTANTRNKSFQMYNKQLWTSHEGVWYSKDNVLTPHLVAVYGTLRKGESNYWHYMYGSEHVGKGETVNRYPLLIKGLPYLINEVDKGYNVTVDVFAVTNSTLEQLDRLEGHPNWYRREQIPVRVKGKIMQCWIYFNITQKLSADSVMHREFSGKSKAKKARYGSWDFDQAVPSVNVSTVNDLFPESCDNYPREEEVREFDISKEKPLCTSCFNDLEDDRYGNYYCTGCGAWYTEYEVIRMND